MESQAVRLNEIDEGRAANCFARSLSETTAKGRYAVTLLAVCAVAFLGVTLVLVVAGRSLVWDTDGRLLYYPFRVGEGEWLRGVPFLLLCLERSLFLFIRSTLALALTGS